jgi:hypothetical protein
MEIDMEIFALMGVIDYEGDMLLGLYVSLEEATDARNVYTRDREMGFDSYYVDRRAVGAPAEANFDDRIEV